MSAKLSNWSTAPVQKLWEQGRILAARLHAGALLPLEIPLRTRDVNHRQVGRQEVPAAACFASADDALRLVGRLTHPGDPALVPRISAALPVPAPARHRGHRHEIH